MNYSKWSELIDFETFYKNNETDSLSSIEDIKDNNESSLEFSLNNEYILKEIDNIILDENKEKYSSLEILKNNELIISYISKSVQNNVVDTKFLYKCIKYLKEASKILFERVKLSEFKHNYNLVKKDKIIRSSYKFCNYKHNCTYNYDKLKKKGCYADHYPHDMVYADCDALLYCLDTYYKNDDEFYNKEIIKCINTISFVIKHMYEELNNLCLYSNKEEHDNFHYVKSNSKKFINNKNNKQTI